MGHEPKAGRGYLLESCWVFLSYYGKHTDQKRIASKVWPGSTELRTEFYLMEREEKMLRENAAKWRDQICLCLDSCYDCVCSCVCTAGPICAGMCVYMQRSKAIIYLCCVFLLCVFMCVSILGVCVCGGCVCIPICIQTLA